MRPRSQVVSIRSRVAAVTLALWLVATLLPAATHAQVPPPGNRMDLPGVIVTPFGLHALGITGYGSNFGVMYHTVEEVLADEYAASRGYMTIADVPGIQQMLTTSGWLQYHEQSYGMIDPANPGGYSQVFAIGIEQYATPDGAAAAFATLTSEGTLAAATTAVTRQPLQPTIPIGEGAALWSHNGYTGDPAFDRRGVTMMVRTGALVVSISQVGFDAANQPDQAAVERAMQRQIDDIAATQASGNAPSCLPGGAGGLCVQRLFGQGVHPEVARYIIRDGIVIPWDDTTHASLMQQQAEATQFNIESAYRHWNYLDGASGSPIVHHFLYTLPDDAGAATYYDYLFGPQDAPPNQVTITVPGATSAATFSTQNSTGTHGTFSHALVGNHVLVVAIDGTAAPVTGVTEALLTSQVSCFQAGNCLAPVAPSPALLQAAA